MHTILWRCKLKLPPNGTLKKPIIDLTKVVIVTPAVYPRLVEFLHFDIQSTGQKSHCVNTVCGHGISNDTHDLHDPYFPKSVLNTTNDHCKCEGQKQYNMVHYIIYGII